MTKRHILATLASITINLIAVFLLKEGDWRGVPLLLIGMYSTYVGGTWSGMMDAMDGDRDLRKEGWYPGVKPGTPWRG